MRSEHAPSASADTADALQPSSIRRKGSKETADAYTTNLSIGNLSPSADEEVLKRTFAAYGPIASVKIMWPRGEDANSRRLARLATCFILALPQAAIAYFLHARWVDIFLQAFASICCIYVPPFG